MTRSTLLGMTSLGSGTYSPVLGRMSPAEQAKGRYMRAPDDHNAPPPPPAPVPPPPPNNALALPDSLDEAGYTALPERVRGLYAKKGDKYEYSDPASLKSALENTKTERNSLRQKAGIAAKLEELGLTVEEVQQLKTARDEAEQKRLKEEGDFEALKGQMQENHQKEIDKHKAREEKLIGTLSSTMIEAKAREILSTEELAGNPVLLLPHIRDRVKIVETDDGFERQVLLPDGKTPMLNAENKPADLEDLFRELKAKPEFADAFKGVNQSGGGAANNGGGGAGSGQQRKSTMDPAAKVAFIESKGIEAYQRLPE